MHLYGWNLFFLVAFAVYVTIRGVYERQTKGNEKVLRRVDARERALLVLVGLGSVLLPAVYFLTSWLSFADYRLPAFILWCGAAIVSAALWLFWRSHADLGKNWSVSLEVRKGHELIRHGVYVSVRHPMYAAVFVWDIGQGLLLENWLAGWSALVTFAVMCILRVPREKEMMSGYFGEAYRE
jgi:protein-S-isoprenylcysteine O-methyltransferase Ste14